MNDKRQILIVDDSPNEIRVLMENLKSEFAILTATTGAAAISSVQKNQPDLVLLDVGMEPMDGYQTCSILQQEFPSTPVIFVSANTKTEEILKGFEVGGRDYITKPVNPAVLKSKIKLTLKQHDAKEQLNDEKTEATSFAQVVMSSASDMGIIHRFLRTGIKLSNPAELALAITDTISEYGLPASVEVRENNAEPCHASTTGKFEPLEKAILTSSVNIGSRMHERGKHLILMYGSVSILIKVMPVDNDKRVGELRDYLMMLVESAHDLNQKITADLSLASKRVTMVLNAVKESEDTMQFIQTFQKQHKQDNVEIMDSLLKEVEKSFFKLGLTEEQEHKITTIIQEKIQQTLGHMEKGLKMDERFKHLTSQLSALSNSF